MNLTTLLTKQREDFEKEFPGELRNETGIPGRLEFLVTKEVKDFLLLSQKQIIECLMGEIEKMKKIEPVKCVCSRNDGRGMCAWHITYNSYNKSIIDVLSLLSSALTEER